MEKVRAQERLDRRVAEHRLHVALKTVARIQDKNQTEDIRAQQQVTAPSLCHHHATLLPLPGHLQVVPGVAPADDDSDKEADTVETEGFLLSVRRKTTIY
jgi:hypothetical protein